MTIQECYERMGGDYADVCARIPSPSLVEKFAVKFLDDPSFAELEGALAAGDAAAAFRAAHTLKGVSANLGFARLTASARALTEALRPAAGAACDQVGDLAAAVRADYAATVGAIRAFLAP